MRVTNQMMSNRMLTNINRNLGLLDKYNTQGSTGKKIQTPSDDPIIASRALKFRTIVSENSQYSKNAVQSESWIDTTETVFVNINKIIIDMKGICEQGASDTYTSEDRQKLMTEYKSLMEQLEQELNTDYMGRNIFSGFRTDKKPIIKDDNGNNILNPEIYGKEADPNAVPPVLGIPPISGGEWDVDGDGIINPDTEVFEPQNIEIQLGAGITVGVNSLVTDMYNQNDFNDLRFGKFDPTDYTPNLQTPAGNDYVGDTHFDRIYNFLNSDEYKNMTSEQKLAWENETAMYTPNPNPNNLPAVEVKVNDMRGMMSKMLTTLEDFQAKISIQDTDIGIRSKRVELVQSRLKDDELNYKSLMSDNEDIDIGDVMMNFNTANAAYMASLNLGMKVNQMTLADYLR